MKYWKNAVAAVALVAVTTVVTARVVSQDPADEEAMMQEWMKYSMPGEQHELLAMGVGKWTQTQTHWMYPGQPPTTSKSTAEMTSIFDGRFVIQKVKGDSMFGPDGPPFEGFGIHGYDNYTKKFFFAWVDNMGTMMMTAEGEVDETGRVITYMSKLPDVMTGEMMTMKSVSRIISKDKQIFEMHKKMPDGSWFQNFKLESNRKK